MEHTSSPTVAAAPARAGLHARRAAAARRRALLTVTLLVLTAATGVLAAGTAVSAWFVLAPAVLLVAVLALGRRAVQANARADAAWQAREHARRAAASDDVRLAGRPAPAVRPRVTGRAVQSSQSQTQMIARVRPTGAADSAGRGSTAEQTQAAVTATTSESTSSGPAVTDAAATDGASAGTGSVPATATTTAAPARTTSANRAAAAGLPAATAVATEWTSVPVPRPVYTMKSAAPRWEPAPLTAEMAQITQARRAELAAGDSAPMADQVDGVDGAAPVLREVEAPSDSLGVNLNSVLARRRAAGE